MKRSIHFGSLALSFSLLALILSWSSCKESVALAPGEISLKLEINAFQVIESITVTSDDAPGLRSTKLEDWQFIVACNGECGYRVEVRFMNGERLSYEGYAEAGYRPVLEVRDGEIIAKSHF